MTLFHSSSGPTKKAHNYGISGDSDHREEQWFLEPTVPHYSYLPLSSLIFIEDPACHLNDLGHLNVALKNFTVFFFLLNQNLNLSRKHKGLNWLSPSVANLFSIINNKSRSYNLLCLNWMRGSWNRVWQLHDGEPLTSDRHTEWVFLHPCKRHCNRICRMSFVSLWAGTS